MKDIKTHKKTHKTLTNGEINTKTKNEWIKNKKNNGEITCK